MDLDTVEETMEAILAPVDRALGAGWSGFFVKAANLSRGVFIYGANNTQTDAAPPPKLNGIAYVIGWDTWSEIGDLFSSLHFNDIQVRFLFFLFFFLLLLLSFPSLRNWSWSMSSWGLTLPRGRSWSPCCSS
jgi:hypothetical protein